MVLFDIDNFKHVSDTYSHLCGNKVLIQVSKILQELVEMNLRALFHLTKKIDYIKKDDFLQKVKDIQIDKHFHITVSIGITFIKADNAFYKAKAKIVMIYE